MLQRILFVIAASVAYSSCCAQFVWPKPEYRKAEPGLYVEDPFIVEYRQKFFSVFRGDFKTFDKAYTEVDDMVRKNPKDARAMVWLGNGQTVKAGLLLGRGKKEEAMKLLAESRKTLDRAVSLRPTDPNIYMMRAATLYIQGQYWPPSAIPRSNWEKLRDDCLKFIKFLGPAKLKRASIHLRGETYGELGIAYAKLGEARKAREAFETVIRLNPDTDYSKRATAEIEKIKSVSNH
jgi:tetratricopeptide (TPR) repeat protein